MKNIIVKNYHDVQPLVQSANGNSFAVKPVIEDVDKCSANFVEVAPGNFAYGYHYHEENEEVFYIISGTAAVKTETGNSLESGRCNLFSGQYQRFSRYP